MENTNTHHEEAKTTTTKKTKKETGYTAIVQYHQEPSDGTTLNGHERPVEFITTKKWKDMTKALADPKVAEIHGIFYGRKINFVTQRTFAIQN